MTTSAILSTVYYIGGASALLLALIRILYGWFRDYDNSQRFAADMALVHLPYINRALMLIAGRLDLELDPPPLINYSREDHPRP